ncbi:sister chromatid cohesion protein Dcc1 [Schizophyllum amplum]|uniref:Sister chromatid cohesion protein Dcc1 n=1 Tax=Schizophyllum amplum TaxID=97359 RepID=A0A550CSE4_9AGAR|nr:sister chromatid cohesion protein Dcc1 [Auriculariopsis ampla]
MTSEYDFAFSPASFDEHGSFKLLELPPEVLGLIESAATATNPSTLTIKGRSNEDAVLCTHDTTYTMRSVLLSNSVLVVTASEGDLQLEKDKGPEEEREAVILRDQINEVIELAKCVPKLHQLTGLLRGKEYDGEEEDETEDEQDTPSASPVTYQAVRNSVQASDAELDRGLRDRRILQLNGELRPTSPSYLLRLLELILNQLVAHSLKPDAAPLDTLTTALADADDVPRAVSGQVLSWFGTIADGKWTMDASALVREIGLGILREHRHDPVTEKALLERWREAATDAFAELCELRLLAGNCITTSSLDTSAERLRYFPSSALPVDPAARFGELFLTRAKWKGDDIAPFLADIAVDSKERDKLLLKYARAMTTPEGIWYTARAQYAS